MVQGAQGALDFPAAFGQAGQEGLQFRPGLDGQVPGPLGQEAVGVVFSGRGQGRRGRFQFPGPPFQFQPLFLRQPGRLESLFTVKTGLGQGAAEGPGAPYYLFFQGRDPVQGCLEILFFSGQSFRVSGQALGLAQAPFQFGRLPLRFGQAVPLIFRPVQIQGQTQLGRPVGQVAGPPFFFQAQSPGLFLQVQGRLVQSGFTGRRPGRLPAAGFQSPFASAGLVRVRLRPPVEAGPGVFQGSAERAGAAGFKFAAPIGQAALEPRLFQGLGLLGAFCGQLPKPGFKPPGFGRRRPGLVPGLG